ncbi:Spy/CpxP family protein refolding chaperone [Massilia sp. DWR3-1-1]|uniref:Spy/CpxP family protein refolding chaperone n=1 Tax=Massilia sp. DWR3-1-1 TaxID=2804559 RepID=UPI003CF911DD
MNTVRKHLVIALAVLGMGSSAFAVQAQTPAAPEGRPGHAMTPEQRAARMGEHWARRQAKLHDLLQLTGGQEAAWSAYQAAIKPSGDLLRPAADGAGWKTLSAPQRLEKMITMGEQHLAKMKSSVGALNTFYSVLTPAQKKIFDEHGLEGPGGRGGHRGHGGHHGGPQGGPHGGPQGGPPPRG